MKTETAISLTIAAVVIGGAYWLYKKFTSTVPVPGAPGNPVPDVSGSVFQAIKSSPSVRSVAVSGGIRTAQADTIGRKAIIASLIAQGVSKTKATAAAAGWHVGQPAPNAGRLLKGGA